MPIYEYICEKCNERFSLLQSMQAREKDAKCPKCLSKNVKKVMSSFCCSSGLGNDFSPSIPSSGFTGGG